MSRARRETATSDEHPQRQQPSLTRKRIHSTTVWVTINSTRSDFLPISCTIGSRLTERTRCPKQGQGVKQSAHSVLVGVLNPDRTTQESPFRPTLGEGLADRTWDIRWRRLTFEFVVTEVNLHHTPLTVDTDIVPF